MRGESTEAAFFVFLILLMFLVSANYPMSDSVRRYAFMLSGMMFLFVPIAIMHKW
jgi:putative effector of murein hydrolase LrgA (UPF0299 family)